MAQRVQVQLVDDLDDQQLATETVSFSLDGKHREIDLSAENAAVFRGLLQPYMTASRPAGSTNIAAKGLLNPEQRPAPEPDMPATDQDEDNSRDQEPEPTLTQTARRQVSADIRKWAHRHDLPINPLGRIPEKTRKAWQQHTQHGNRSLLDQLLTKAGIDPATTPAKESNDNVVSITSGKPTAEEQLERRARTVGKLSDHQRNRLRDACSGDGTAVAKDPTDRSSYQALVRRGCMTLTGEDTYAVTDVGRTWIRLNQPALSA
ncbi:Lsr2 family protein [Streptomyces sp. NPDC005499]|uniref:histone-like nucleoid-structuring protein Lsr2 n=1 Tax=Streptomyces sp. NPDC005499 TaxID=3154883 RepID=UPI0033BF3261